MAQNIRWLMAVCLLMCGAAQAQPGALDRGRYLVVIGHCNNCHTAGYMEAGGAVPESAWLMGNVVGWRSAAGTTYPGNLRIYFRGPAGDVPLHPVTVAAR